jgi:TolB protein
MEPDTLLEGGPTSTSPETVPIRGSTKAIRKTFEVIKTNKIRAGLFLLLLAVVLGGGYFIITRRQIEKVTKPEITQAPRLLRTLQVTFKPGFDRDPTLSPDGNAVAYTSTREGSSEIFVKQLAAGGDEIQLTADGEENVEPAWSPDGQRIVFSKNRRGIWVVPALGGVPKQLAEFGSAPAWSRDGTFVAFQSGAALSLQPVTIWIVPSSGGSPKQITQNGTPPGSHVNPCWSPDSKRIAFAANSSLWSISIPGGELKNLGPANFNPGLPVFSPGGEFLYFTGFSGTTAGLWQLRISSTNGDPLGEPQLVTNTPLNSFISRFSVSAGGKKIAYSLAQTRGNLYSLPVSSGGKAPAAGPVLFTNDTGGRRGPLSFSPDGSKIAFSQFRAGIGTDIFLIDADGKNLTQLTFDPAPDIVSNWFPGGDRIAFISNRKGASGLWAISLQGGKEEFLLELGQGVDYARLSPDGSAVAFNERKGSTNTIWVMRGGERRQLESDSGPIGYPSWSPDGKFLAVELRRGSNSHVGVIPRAGGSVTQLTNDEGLSFVHSWSPDSEKMAFAGRRNGIWNIYWVSMTTKEQEQLTKNTNQNSVMRYPTWSPSGNQIIYDYSETTGNIWLMELK